MKKLILLLVALAAMGTILTGYALSGSQAEPVGVPPSTGEALVSDANGNVLKCNGKLAKVKVGGPPPVATPFGGGAPPTMMDRSNKLQGYGCEKKNGKETGEVTLVELP